MAIVEIAHFKLKPDADEKAFLAAEQGLVNGQIRQQPGFLGREAAKGADGEWIVILHWETVADAEAWTPKFMQDPNGQAFAAQLDFSTMKQERYEVVKF